MRYREAFTVFRRRVPSGKRVFYMRISSGGRRRQWSLGTTKKGEAFKKASELFWKLSNMGVFPIECRYPAYPGPEFEKERKAPLPLFSAYAAGWWVRESCDYTQKAELQGKRLSDNYLENMRIMLRKYILPTFGTLRLDEITTSKIEDWKLGVSKEGKSSTTVERAADCLRRMLDEAVRLDVMVSNPVSKVKRYRIKAKEKGVFTKEEVFTLFRQYDFLTVNAGQTIWGKNPQMFLATIFSLTTGARRGEVAGIQWENVDLEKGVVRIPNSLDEFGNLKTTKGGYSRESAISQKVIDGLRALPHRSGFVFCSDGKGSKPFHPGSYSQAFDRVLDTAGIDRRGRNISFHSLRHQYVSMLKAHGVSDALTRSTVGHKSAQISERYTHISGEHLQPVKDALSELFD